MTTQESDYVACLSCQPWFQDEAVGSTSELRVGLKRVFDIVCSVFIMVFAAPLVLLAMLFVRLSSRGPVIYSQIRLGQNGRMFMIYKIRTMKHDCEHSSGPQWATRRDPRVIRGGHFLRATHIDELPQLVNVLLGQMSLVGPRPERPQISKQLRKVIALYDERLRVLPGLTGLAQVQLPPDEDVGGVNRKLACDLYYILNQNLWLDLRILLSTALGVLMIPFVASRVILRIPSGRLVELAFEEMRSRTRAGLPHATPTADMAGEAETQPGLSLSDLVDTGLTSPAPAN